ncbi:MAG: TetR/AcrR family transcriptional regulator [Acidimicrobiales bacterium]
MSDGAAATPPRDRSRRRGRDAVDAQPATRGQIVDAAIASILELGFYRASSNEIARRANVSWGSIQYHFGSREALLLAVLEELNQRFTTLVSRARIDGETLEERLHSLYTTLARNYGSPIYLARLQIILNLSHDPDTSADVADALARIADVAGHDLRRLFLDVLGDGASPATVSVVFNAIRGTALSHQITDAMPHHGPSRSRGAEKEELTRLLAGLAAAARLDPGVDP